MISQCAICHLEKETRAAVCPTEFAYEEQSDQWHICENCEPAYEVVLEYLQGQN